MAPPTKPSTPSSPIPASSSDQMAQAIQQAGLLERQMKDQEMSTNTAREATVDYLDSLGQLVGSMELATRGLYSLTSAQDSYYRSSTQNTASFAAAAQNLSVTMIATQGASRMYEDLRADAVRSGVGVQTLIDRQTALADLVEKRKGPFTALSENQAVWLSNAIKTNIQTEILTKTLMQASVAQGTFGSWFKDNGTELVNYRERVDAFEDSILQSALSTNLSRKEAMEFGLALNQLPGAMGAVVQGLGAGTDSSLSFLTAMIQVSKGVGLTQSEIKDKFESLRSSLNFDFSKGEDAKKGLEFIAQMSAYSQKLQMDQKELGQQIISVAEKFRYLSSSTESVQSVGDRIGKFAIILKDAGLSAKNAFELSKSYVDQMTGINAAQMSFVSQSTGGPGGLFGAAQIEKLISEGKFGEVADKVNQTLLAQMTSIGPITTLKEVTDESSAARRQAQIEMLQKGPLGALADDPKKAEKLLSLLQGIQSGRAESLQDVTSLLQTAYGRGDAITKKDFGAADALSSLTESAQASGRKLGTKIHDKLKEGTINPGGLDPNFYLGRAREQERERSVAALIESGDENLAIFNQISEQGQMFSTLLGSLVSTVEPINNSFKEIAEMLGKTEIDFQDGEKKVAAAKSGGTKTRMEEAVEKAIRDAGLSKKLSDEDRAKKEAEIRRRAEAEYKKRSGDETILSRDDVWAASANAATKARAEAEKKEKEASQPQGSLSLQATGGKVNLICSTCAAVGTAQLTH